MYTIPSIIAIVINSALLILYLIMKRRLQMTPLPLNQPKDKKRQWEQVLINQQEETQIQQEPELIHHSSPRNDFITNQFWFIQKYFLIFALKNHSHFFYLLMPFNKEYCAFKCRFPSLHWQSLILPMMLYQLVCALSPQYIVIPFLMLIGILNIVQSYLNLPKDELEQSMNFITRKLSIMKEIFQQTYEQEPQLSRYAYALQQTGEQSWMFALFVCAFLISLSINQLEWPYIFGFIYGAITEQFLRGGFCIIYARIKAKKWILEGPDCVHEEMLIYAEYLKPNVQIPRQSPQKYIMNDTHNLSGMSKDQSNILIHNSMNDLLNKNKQQILRVTSANLGTIEDTKLDIADLQSKPIDSEKPLDSEQNMNHQTLIIKTEQQETQAEEAIFKKKKAHHRIKLEALYHSKNTQRSPLPPPQFYSSKKSNPHSKSNSPPPDFNPIQILQQLSPFGSNQVSQREQFPHTFDDQLSNIKVNSNVDDTISPKHEPLQVLSNIHQNRQSFNQSFGSQKVKRNNSQKISKDEEEQSYKERKKIKVSSLRGPHKSPEQGKRRRSTNTKLRGESLKLRKREDIPVLNFDSERFKSPYLEFLPAIVDTQQQQKTHRKQNQSNNKKMIKQMIQVCENNQTSNENRGRD